MQAIILGNTRGFRRLDAQKSMPLHLLETGRHRRALDWILQALQQNGITQIHYIGGYHIEKIVEKYPDLKFHYYSRWATGNELGALQCLASELTGPAIICSANIIFFAEAIQFLLKSAAEKNQNVLFGIDESIKKLFAGLLFLNQQGAAVFRENLLQWGKQYKKLSEVYQELQNNKNVGVVNLQEKFALLTNRQEAVRFVLGSKSQTLDRLRPHVQNSIILDQYNFTVADWQSKQDLILHDIQEKYSNKKIIVRSSALGEDGWEKSEAGKFTSILNVSANDKNKLEKAILDVVHSFKDSSNQHQVFIQEQLTDVALSGVVFSRSLEYQAPYFIVNCDRTGSTNSVTSGAKLMLETWVAYKKDYQKIKDQSIREILTAVIELEHIVGHDGLDVEFCIGHDKKIYILQVRPLSQAGIDSVIDDQDIEDELKNIIEFGSVLLRQHPLLAGKTSALGIMPDWNPAEMIGTTPKPLALSLYQTLITNNVWVKARAQLGYQDLSEIPLLFSLAGRPYIDVRASLNSLLPAGLGTELREKLINFYIQKLHRNPQIHDKIEFELIATCLDSNFEKLSKDLQENQFSNTEITELKNKLHTLTENIISQKTLSIVDELAKLNTLNERRSCLLAREGETALTEAARSLEYLILDCKKYGTMPFSVLARAAFIALSFLRSFESASILTSQERDEILRNIPTVASDLNRDIELYTVDKLSKGAFLSVYGHLRPSSYDICSANFAKGFSVYLSKSVQKSSIKSDIKVAYSLLEMKAKPIDALLKKLDLTVSVSQIISFIINAITAREKAKFEFMKNVDAILFIIEKIGQAYGFSADDLSYVPVDIFSKLSLNSASCAFQAELERTISFQRKRYSLTRAIQLPFLICHSDDFTCFQRMQWQPNFITAKKKTAEVFCIDSIEKLQNKNFENKIVVIESADPGYDWLFSHSIAGLITKYGGAASHMAIRAAEFGLPAAIGCGDQLFDSIKNAVTIDLDCAAKQIRIIQ